MLEASIGKETNRDKDKQNFTIMSENILLSLRTSVYINTFTKPGARHFHSNVFKLK